MPDKRAIYAFSGDPITFGHIDIVKRVASTYRYVGVAIGNNPAKINAYLFSSQERLTLAKLALQDIPNVECMIMDGLLAEYAFRHGFDVIVRGVRNTSDLEAELSFFAVNATIHPQVDTILIPARPELAHISSSVVKALVLEGGDVSQFCPLFVKQKLERRLLGKLFIGIAGGIASGKSTLAQELSSRLNKHVETTYLSLDQIGHEILGQTPEILYQKTREKIVETFGQEVRRPDGSIDRTRLGQIVFSNQQALHRLNQIMRDPMLARLYERIRATEAGIVLLEGAILIEGNWTSLVNNHIILVDAPESERIQRLMKRNQISEEEARRKIIRQPTHQERYNLLQKQIHHAHWGRCWEIQATGNIQSSIENLVEEILMIWQTDPPSPF